MAHLTRALVLLVAVGVASACGGERAAEPQSPKPEIRQLLRVLPLSALDEIDRELYAELARAHPEWKRHHPQVAVLVDPGYAYEYRYIAVVERGLVPGDPVQVEAPWGELGRISVSVSSTSRAPVAPPGETRAAARVVAARA